MATTTFTNGITLTDADWFNDVDAVVYEWLGDGTNEPATRAAARNNFFTGGSTGSDSPVINATQTWNSAGTTFTGIKLNITDTNSAAASLLADLQMNGTSKWKVTKAGAVTQTSGLVIAAGGLAVTGAITCTLTGTSSKFITGNGATNYSAEFQDENLVNPRGIRITYTAAAPNDDSAEHYALYFSDSGGERCTIKANGGIRNYSANNVNLSDRAVKPTFEVYTPALLDAMATALENVDWGRYKYADQTHDDWNHGPTAQGVEEAFKHCAPEIVGEWNATLKAIYTHDLVNIAIASLLHRIKKLEAGN